MKKMLLAPMVILLTVVGCASNGDVAELHAHVDSDMAALQSHIDADMKAMAESDAKSLAEVNTKLDNMFKKSMTK